MTRVPKVSLYIPAYNAERFVNASVESILSQTFVPDEILVIDDGSHDATAEVVSRYKEIKLIRHDKNRGLAAARNTAVRAARNELVGSVDADCAAAPEWLEKLVPAFEDPKIAGAGGRLLEGFRDNLADRWRCVHMRMDRGEQRIRNPMFLHGCNGLYRKSALLGVGGYDEAMLTAGDDADIGRRLSSAGWELLHEPEARVTHLRRDSVESVLRSYWQWVHFGFGPDQRAARLRLHNIIRHCFLGNVRHMFAGLALDDLQNSRFELLWIDFLTLVYFPWRDLCERRRIRPQREH
jgi:cellulose synthase/poly-beta-1,6-N-acetylglucosamine synthase-like glycosyltransferase